MRAGARHRRLHPRLERGGEPARRARRARGRAARCGRARDRRRLDRRDGRRGARHGATVVSFGENRGLRAGIAAGYREAHERGYAYCGRVDADGQHPVDELARLLDLVRSDACDVAVGSRFAEGEGYDAERYEPSPARRFGIGLLQKAMHVRLGRPFHDPTSGMAAVNAQGDAGDGRALRERRAGGGGAAPAEARPACASRRSPSTCASGRTASRSCRDEGRQARPDGRRHAALLPLAAPPPVVSQAARLVVVLGYSDGGRGELHPVCAARLERAAEVDDLGRRRRALGLGARAGHALGGRAHARGMARRGTGGRRRSGRPDDGRQHGERAERRPPRGRRRGARRDVVVARTPGEGGASLAAPLDGDQGARRLTAGPRRAARRSASSRCGCSSRSSSGRPGARRGPSSLLAKQDSAGAESCGLIPAFGGARP